MATVEEIQALLRFLSAEAKIPMALALGRIQGLKEANIASIDAIAKTNLATLTPIFIEEKTAKTVLNAAKRHGKKRAGPTPSSPPSKRTRPSGPVNPNDPAALEASLALPELVTDEARLRATVLITNRAPLVLAFGVMLLKYTMPEQPLSSRLSLAQAAVSMNSRSKAVSLGLESGKSAEEEGWGAGQKPAKVMGRDVRTMKRVGWEPVPEPMEEENHAVAGEESQTVQDSPDIVRAERPMALWALDLEALRGKPGETNDGTGVGLRSDLPIYTPQSARSYLGRAFERKPTEDEAPNGKKATGRKPADKEANLGLVLGALDLLFDSWSGTITASELDSRAWSWYIRVRPEVASGVSGWGAKGELALARILELRKSS